MSSPLPAATPTTFTDLFALITDNVQQVIQGKPEVVELALMCLVAEGHLLIEDVPGVGKTSLAKALSASINCQWGRVQFTPDLLPSDVVGVTVWNRGRDLFEFRRGPIFANIVLADEINRASPKTQSALLEAMEERQITVDGTTYPLGSAVHGDRDAEPDRARRHLPPPREPARPLPHASLSRVPRASEIEILERHGEGSRLPDLAAVASALDVRRMAAAVRTVHIAPGIRSYFVDLADASRRHRSLSLGMSPRATLALQRASRAHAAANGRNYVVPDDVKAVAVPVLAHRLLMAPDAQLTGADTKHVIGELLAAVPVPSGRATSG